jgi:hypothetical protein
LTAVETQFSKDSVQVMKPLSKALDIFQNEESKSLGCVLPTVGPCCLPFVGFFLSKKAHYLMLGFQVKKMPTPNKLKLSANFYNEFDKSFLISMADPV